MPWRGNMEIVSDERISDSDPCRMCTDSNIITLSNGEMYRVCAPNKWKSYECAARQLVTLKKPAAHADPRKQQNLCRAR